MNKAILTAGAACALLLGGCDKKVGGQVVAVVDGEEVTQQELNAELGGASLPEGADRKAIMTQLLQRIVDRKLLVAEAKKQGLDKSPTFLAQVQRGQDAVLVELLAGKVAKGTPVPDAAAADRFVQGNPTLFAGRKRYELDQIAFRAPNDPALGEKLKPARTLPEVEAVLKGEGIPFQRGAAQLDTGSLAPAIASRIASLPPGEPFLVPQNGQMVVSVIRRTESVPVQSQQARPAAVELLRRQAVEQAMRKQVEQARTTAKIEYDPAFAPPKGTKGAGAASTTS